MTSLKSSLHYDAYISPVLAMPTQKQFLSWSLHLLCSTAYTFK